MIVLILIIGINSLLMGYGLAVLLGYGPPSGAGTDWLLSLVPAAPGKSAKRAEPLARSALFVGPSRPAEQGPSPAPASHEEGAFDDRHVEMLLHGLNQAVLRSGRKAEEIDARLRAFQGQYDPASIGQCAAELLADCEALLSVQSEATARFRDRAAQVGTPRSLVEQSELANLELSAQIETAIGHLRQIDGQSDLAAAAERLLYEIHDLHVARNRLRDDQAQLFVAIARHEARLISIDERLKTDALTGSPNRVGLEAALAQWWHDGLPASRPLSAALLDLDHFGNLSKAHGSRAGDGILRHVGQCLLQATGEGRLVGRYAGQRFLVVALEVDRAGLAGMVERARRSIERTDFRCRGQSIQVTVSAAMDELAAGEGPAEFLQRLEQTLADVRHREPAPSVLGAFDEADLREPFALGAARPEIEV